MNLVISAPQNLPEYGLSPFSDILSGDNAFYKASNYKDRTKKELKQNDLLPVSYTVETEYKIIKIIKKIFSIIFFPIWIYQCLHSLVGRLIVPATDDFSEDLLCKMRSSVSVDGEWKYKRITIQVDDHKIDALILGKDSTFGNGRWILNSNGNGTPYEGYLYNEFLHTKIREENLPFHHIVDALKSNAILFNYSGVGASDGAPNKDVIVKAYRTILTFLEDKENGIGAKEIIGIGHSLGGGVQGDALYAHELKDDVKYVFVKSKTFSNLQTEISELTGSWFLGFLAKLLGWNIDSVASSKKLNAKEIIIQTAKINEENQYELLKDSSSIISDGVIYTEATLAKALLNDEQVDNTNKIYVGVKETHNEGFEKSILSIVHLIEEGLNA